MNDISPTYPACLPCRLGCYIPPKYAEDCRYYEEEMDMGARIPICMKSSQIDPSGCNSSCPNYRNKYELLTSETEIEPHRYEDYVMI